MNLDALLAELAPGTDAAAAGHAAILVTPRFAASRHVVVLAVPRGAATPTLVVKIPRLGHDSSGVERERDVLAALERLPGAARAGVPRIVAYGALRDRAVLVETYVDGVPLTRQRVRRDPAGAIRTALAWLLTLRTRDAAEDRFSRLVERPLSRFGSGFGGAEADLAERTLEIAAPLRDADLRGVVEHGDLSHPNLLTLPDGGLGVIDWELGEVDGLPTHDLVFFVNYVATARADATTTDEHVRAFHDALISPTGWARPTLETYADHMKVKRRFLGPLLVVCWARYTAGLVSRLSGHDAAEPSRDLVRRLRADRHYALWRHALEHASTAW